MKRRDQHDFCYRQRVERSCNRWQCAGDGNSHDLGDFGFQTGIEHSHESAGNDEPVDLVSTHEVGGTGGDLVGLSFEVMIGIFQQAETLHWSR